MLETINQSDFKTKVFDYSLNENEWINNTDKPCCVFFYAAWCDICPTTRKMMGAYAEKYPEIKFYQIDCDKNEELSNTLHIETLPSILFVPRQAEPQLLKGGMPEKMIEFLIEDVLVSLK